MEKYKKGEKIKNIDELLQQEFVYWKDKIIHKGWFRSWQIGMVDNAIRSGIVCKAIKRSKEEN